MKEVAGRLLAASVGELREPDPQRRAAELLRKLKGVAQGVCVEQEGDHLQVRACGCPLASVTASHPEVCDLLAEVLGEMLGTQVRERCDRKDSPHCCFEIDPGE